MINLMKSTVEKKTKVLLAVVLCVLIALPVFSWGADFTGHWTGTRIPVDGGSYSLTTNVAQTGTSLSGTFTTGAGCGNSLVDIPVTGSVSGNTATFQGSFICNNLGATLTLAFTNALISGNTISGNYAACYQDNPSTCVDVGSFALTTTAFQLTVSTSGTGSGSVSSDPDAIYNCRTSCSSGFNALSHVILTATPDFGSVLTSWSIGSCTAPGTCTVTMDAIKNVTATFGPVCSDRVARGGNSIYYTNIQDAYNATNSYKSVQMQAGDFGDSLLMQNNTIVKLQGGFDCGYTSNPDWTTITRLTIQQGTATVEKVKIK
jgi:hypothetical protein